MKVSRSALTRSQFRVCYQLSTQTYQAQRLYWYGWSTTLYWCLLPHFETNMAQRYPTREAAEAEILDVLRRLNATRGPWTVLS